MMPGIVQDDTSMEPTNGSGEMFDRIAQRYDLLNRLISLGIDQSWRRKTVDALELNGDAEVLDLATGTADLALLSAKRWPRCRVVGVDPSAQMLGVGMAKVRSRGLEDRIELLKGDAQALPFVANRFDGITMAFGIRNVPDRSRALREMVRVCKPGARVCILELSEPRTGIMSHLARFHMHTVVPWLGSILSGEREYRYLPQSISAFPPPADFVRLAQDAGLERVRPLALTFGVCHLYVGSVPGRRQAPSDQPR